MINFVLLHVIFHFSNRDNLFLRGQVPDGLVILILDGGNNLSDSVLEGSDSGVNEVIGVRGIVIGVEFELNEASLDELFCD